MSTSSKVSRDQIRGLITDLKVTDVQKVEVELGGPSPAFRCQSCDEPFYWANERWICAICQFEFGIVNAIEILQYQISRMEAVQEALAELLPEEELKQLGKDGSASADGSKKPGLLSRFFKRTGGPGEQSD